MVSVVIEAFKKLCFSVHLSQIVVWYTVTGVYITLHNSSARLDGIHPVEIHDHLIGTFGIHLITAVSLIKRLILYEVTQTLGPRFDRFSVRCPYYRGFFKENI